MKMWRALLDLSTGSNLVLLHVVIVEICLKVVSSQVLIKVR